MTTTALATIDPDRPGWVATLEPAAQLAHQIANTEFVPSSMRGSVPKVTACVMFGAELGIGPLQSLAKIDIIEGRPAPKAELARALVLAAGHELVIRESSTTRAVVAGRRRGSDEWQTTTWTLDDAKRAGLDTKQNWRKWPRQMLIARASAELARMSFPDCLGGVSLFAEELDDDAEPGDVTPAATPSAKAASRSRKLSQPPTQAAIAAPVVDDGDADPGLPPLPDEIEEVEAVDLITDPQMRKMLATLGGLGVKDRGDRLALTSSIVGATIPSAKDLTKAQATKVIEHLSAIEDRRAELRYDPEGKPFVHLFDESEDS